MLFYSFEFLYLFLPIAVIGYYCIGGQSRAFSVKWIVGCSLFFYGWWNPYYVLFLVGSMLFNYYFGLMLSTSKYKYLLFFCILVNLGFIGYFKYTGFLTEIISNLSGLSVDVGKIVLPLGISFFTFQQISWLVDNYYDRINDQKKGLWEYGQFVVFFPQLIAGPIVHHAEMIPQFHDEKNRYVNWDNIAGGMSIFVMGLAKKIIIADHAAPYVNKIFSDPSVLDGLQFVDAWIGALAYTVQIYFDFSGYADMAIGLGLMFNIHLPLNFASPYKSISISEFWRRWHMTLGRFLKDYVYIPLGGSRCRDIRYYYNLWLTMLICGLWHGAGWNFVIWGGLHGAYLVINGIWRKSARLKLPNPLSVCITFFSVVFAWVLFRAETLEVAWVIMKAMGDLSEMGSFQCKVPGMKDGLFVIIPALFIGFFMPNSQDIIGNALNTPNPLKSRKPSPQSTYLIWRPNLYWAGYIAFLSLVSVYCLIDQSVVQEFIYFQF